MKKTNQLTFRVNNVIYSKLQALKARNINVSNMILKLLLNNNVRKNYILSDFNFCNKITIRLSKFDKSLIKDKFCKNKFTLFVNNLLEDKLECLSKDEQKQLKKLENIREREMKELLHSLKLLMG